MDRKPITKLALIVNDTAYELSSSQLRQLNDWREMVIERIDQINRYRSISGLTEMLREQGTAYTGAGGGGVDLTFSITPIGIGTVFKVAESTTGEAVDLTNYSW